MKKILILLVLLSAFRFPPSALAWTVTNFTVGVETNWNTQVIPKLNNNYNNIVGWLNSHDTNLTAISSNYFALKMAFTNFVATNTSGGSSGGLTNIVFTNNVNADVVQVFNDGTTAAYSITVNVTNTFTNTIAAYTFSNSILCSKRILTYATNAAYWKASNYLARVSGLIEWSLIPGNDGDNPPMPIPMTLRGSYNGTNGWFIITNGFTTASNITLVTTTNGLSQRGSPLVMPGSARFYSIDHWELRGVTNTLDYQYLIRNTPVSDPKDVATKEYVDGVFGSAFDSRWAKSLDAGNTNHYSITLDGGLGQDFVWNLVYVPIKDSYSSGLVEYSPGVFGPTNFVIEVYSTNLAAGWFIRSGTDLAFPATNWTTFTTNASAGVTTITIPMDRSESFRYFQVLSSSSLGVHIAPTLTLDGGTIYPSNSWPGLANITNKMGNFAFWVGASNGQAMVTIWKSNAAAYYIVPSNGVSLKVPAQ